MVREPILFVGVDWASETHHVCVVGPDGAMRRERTFRHCGAGLAEMAEWIVAGTGAAAEDVPVAIEVPHGPVVESLMDRGYPVYAVNPKQLDRFRDRFSPAGAKDDSRDARVLADALRTDRHRLRRIDPVDPTVVELREWSRSAGELTRDRARLANRVREVERFLKRHRIRRITADRVLELLRATPVPVAPGTTEAAVAHIRSASERLRLAQRQLRGARREIGRLLRRLADGGDAGAEPPGGQRDVTILSSMPGVGRTVLATLLAEATQPLRRRDYQALRLCGVAPVTRRSGKSILVVRRLAAHPRLRDAVYHWARVAVQHDPVSKAKYAALRARGHGHARALRSVADRLLAVACAMLRTQTRYDPNHPRAQHAA
ncbi:IS110 family transposase [Candidatus Palauibacter sp.]|uniref:IS110 family transposase n=1 Tax=Candidatus Palauibacter sp. TaxID=3101350 RepID=UPI003C6FC6C3